MTWFAAQLYLHDSLLTQYTVSTKHSNFTLECHCLETAQSELILITWSYKLIRTSTILIAQVWKPPNISKTHCIPNTREHEIELLSPFLTIVLDFHFFRAIFNGHLFDKSSAAVFWSSRFLVRDNNAIDLCLWHVLRWTLIDRFVGLCCAWGKAIKCTLEIRDLPLYQTLIIGRPDHEASLELQLSHTNFYTCMQIWKPSLKSPCAYFRQFQFRYRSVSTQTEDYCYHANETWQRWSHCFLTLKTTVRSQSAVFTAPFKY